MGERVGLTSHSFLLFARFNVNLGVTMAQSDIVSFVVPACEMLANEMQYELVDVELVKEGAGKYLRIYIDKPGGITLDDCEVYHRAIAPKVERVDYDYLEICSPGMDRPLKKQRDFDAHAGKEVQVRLYKPVDKKKVFEGVLVGLLDGEIVLDTPQGQLRFAQKSASRVVPVLRFDELDFDDLNEEGAGEDEP